MKNMKLRGLVFLAACTLSMAAWAGGHVACKIGQKPPHQGGAACAPAPKATSKGASKGTSRPMAKGKGKVTYKSKSKAHFKPASKGNFKTSALGDVPARTEPAPSIAAVDCGSTRILLQGGAAQCSNNSAASAQANPGSACFTALEASNASRHLSPRVPFLSGSAASPEAMANKSLPSQRDREELRSVIAGYGMCMDMAASWRSASYAPAVVSALDAFWLGAQSILNELAVGKRTFGDAARAITESDKSYQIRLGPMQQSLQPVATLHAPNAAQ